jgi:hypothetical protein
MLGVVCCRSVLRKAQELKALKAQSFTNMLGVLRREGCHTVYVNLLLWDALLVVITTGRKSQDFPDQF